MQGQHGSARTCCGVSSSPCTAQQVQGHPAPPFSSLATLWHQLSSSWGWPQGGGALLPGRRVSCLLQGALGPGLCLAGLLRLVVGQAETRGVRR